MRRERNWSGNHVFEARRIHRPATVDEARRIVSGSSKIHAVGARHSFNGVADSPGDLIDLRGSGFPPVDRSIERHRSRQSKSVRDELAGAISN